MKDTILKAINKGLMNVLTTDINDQDINYSHNDIDSKYNVVSNMVDLLDLFKDDNDIIFYTDTSCCLTLILKDCSEISLKDIDTVNYDDIIMIRLTDSAITRPFDESDDSHSINIYKNTYFEKAQWHNSGINEEVFDPCMCVHMYDVLAHKYTSPYIYDGYTCMYDNVNIPDTGKNRFTDYPAFEYIVKLNRRKKIPGFKAYMTSVGELDFIMKYQDIINHIFKRIKGVLFFIDKQRMWTSNELNKSTVWYWDDQSQKFNFVSKYNPKVPAYVMPIYKRV